MRLSLILGAGAGALAVGVLFAVGLHVVAWVVISAVAGTLAARIAAARDAAAYARQGMRVAPGWERDDLLDVADAVGVAADPYADLDAIERHANRGRA